MIFIVWTYNSDWQRAPDQCFRGEFENYFQLRLMVKKKTSKSCLAACLLDKNCSGYHHTSPEDCFLLMMTSPWKLSFVFSVNKFIRSCNDSFDFFKISHSDKYDEITQLLLNDSYWVIVSNLWRKSKNSIESSIYPPTSRIPLKKFEFDQPI